MADVILPESMKQSYNRFHFAPAVRANGSLYFSGQIGTDANGKVPESAEEEFRNAWTYIGVVLSEAGLDYSNIVEFTSYHVDMHDHLGDFVKVKDEFIKEPYPAWTAIGTTTLAFPGARAEVRVIATT
jgi:enamine deaminase RidA (YjgF/YER057c/UK114 family)